MPDIFTPPHLQPTGDVSGFPLGDNATAQEVMTLMDSLALKIHPEAYWQLSWITSSLNVIIFIFIAMAMRIYRSQKSPVALWLFKLERRPYKVNWVRTQYRKLFRSRAAAHSVTPEKAACTTTDAPNADAEESETRTGLFITASCVNCHLVLTSAYVLFLFVRVIEGYMSRHASASPPLIEPSMIDAVMYAFIFSTAYFAALGYIAILLPDIPPWIWNNAVVSGYIATILCGLISLISIAASSSKISYYRTLVYNGLYTLPSLSDPVSVDHEGVERAVSAAVLQMARAAYKEAMDQRVWLLCAHGLVSLGGILLSFGYLLIFVTLTKNVAGELVQLRNDPRPGPDRAPSAPVNPHGVTTWPTASVPFSAPASQPSNQVLTTFLAQPNRFSLPLRMAGRTPPPTPAPSGPLPLPPSRPSSRYSISESSSHGARETLVDASPKTLRTKPSMSSMREHGIASERRHSVTQQQENSMETTLTQSRRGSVQTIFADGNSSHPELAQPSVEEGEELRFGPRTRLDSEPAPWAIDTLHDDLASNEGYVAVCRFLFNCIIDHLAVTLQCFAFGVSSIYLCIIYGNEHPYDAQKASMQVARVNMVFSCSFTVLYLINSLNLFAPFLLFPSSQVKLATMLASLTSPHARLHLPGTSDLGGFARRKLSTKKSKHSLKSGLQAGSDSPALDRKESATELLGSTSKVTSESYSSPSSQEFRHAQPCPNHPCADRYPPNNSYGAKQGASSSLASKQSIKWEDSADSATKPDSNPVGRVAAQAAGTVKMFHTRPNADGCSGSPNSARGSPFSSANTTVKGLQSHESALDFAAQADEPATGLGLWTTLTKLSPFSRSQHPPTSCPSQLTTKPLPDTQSVYASSEGTHSHRAPKGRQLVLDSLISSHALPIQGFYCQRTTAAGSQSTLNIYQLNEMVERGIATSRHEDARRAQQQSERPWARLEQQRLQQQHQPQSRQKEDEEEDGERGEGELQPLPSDSAAEDPLGSEESQRRRQRLRQQFRSQLDLHRPTTSRSAQQDLEVGRARRSSSISRAHLPLSPRQTAATPTNPVPDQPMRQRASTEHETVISIPVPIYTGFDESTSASTDSNELRTVDDEEKASVETETFGRV